MLKGLKDTIKSFISGNTEVEFDKQIYTEHGMIALGRSCGMTEGELKVLIQSINRIEGKTKKSKESFISELSQNGKSTKEGKLNSESIEPTVKEEEKTL